ncbi:hypothetical protein BC830DRAFT_1089465 [Chytriomyces sp. MP71]|nr:hypothetical protein BC830DRAFT_1089465 [Chytriomyces sp. MP71]
MLTHTAADTGSQAAWRHAMDLTQMREPLLPRTHLDGNNLQSQLDTLVATLPPPVTDPTPPASPSIRTDPSPTSAMSRPTTGPTKESSASGRAPTCGATMAKYLASTSAPRTKSVASKLGSVDTPLTQVTRKATKTLGATLPKTFPAAQRDAARIGTMTATTCLTELVSARAQTRSRTASTKKYSHSQGQ